MSQAAEEFLREFGGLHLVYPHAVVHDSEDNCELDPVAAILGRDPCWLREYETRTGEAPLTPIGEAAGGYLILSMSSSGSVYAGYDDELRYVGETGAAALEALICGTTLQRVP